MKRRHAADFEPFPAELLAPDAPLLRHGNELLVDALRKARWGFIDYLAARVEVRRRAAGWVWRAGRLAPPSWSPDERE